MIKSRGKEFSNDYVDSRPYERLSLRIHMPPICEEENLPCFCLPQ